MKDTTPNYKAFLHELDKLSELFSDAMSETRLELYWESLGHEVTLEEWQMACADARDRETFHKVPLPAVLWGYVEERRAQRRLAQIKAQQAYWKSPEGKEYAARFIAEEQRQIALISTRKELPSGEKTA